MSRRIIIDIRTADIPFSRAAELVARVLETGYISETRGVKKCCHATIFGEAPDQIVVSARNRRTETSADSFVVYREGEGEK